MNSRFDKCIRLCQEIETDAYNHENKDNHSYVKKDAETVSYTRRGLEIFSYKEITRLLIIDSKITRIVLVIVEDVGVLFRDRYYINIVRTNKID